MKNVSKTFLYAMGLIAITLILPMALFAQTLADPDSPIDGGLSLLIAAGIGYGAKKVHDNKKKKQAENNKQDL